MRTRRSVEIRWNLRRLMAERNMYSTTDLQPLLAARGVELSATQVYRLVTSAPERLNTRVLAAICDGLDCTPNDLIEVVASETQTPAKAVGGPGTGSGPRPTDRRPKRVKIAPDD